MTRQERLARRYAAALARMRAAIAAGDADGAAYLAREARRLRAAIAEG